jgi:hypothetical protein
MAGAEKTLGSKLEVRQNVEIARSMRGSMAMSFFSKRLKQLILHARRKVIHERQNDRISSAPFAQNVF